MRGRWRKWKSEISSTSQRGGTKEKWNITTFSSCVQNKKEREQRLFFLLSLSSWAVLIFSSPFVSLSGIFFLLDSLTFLSFALSTLVCPPFPPSFLSESVPDYSGQLQFKMTKWRSSSCHKIKWNEMAHGKSRRMLVCSPVCVRALKCVYDAVYCAYLLCCTSNSVWHLPSTVHLYQSFWVNRPQMQSELM